MLNSLYANGDRSQDFNTFLGYKILSGVTAGMLSAVLINRVYIALPGFFCFFAAGFFRRFCGTGGFPAFFYARICEIQ